ncbi:hypothetical protein [Malaciobacter mytili]|uniref:hypothetical protein n=1 Tax=Malaciobacter mytili TaxID=603050 RepID=UPI003A8BF541
MKTLVIFLFNLILITSASAYSYSAAGSEPILETREKVLKALENKDYIKAKLYIDEIMVDIAYLSTKSKQPLLSDFKDAFFKKDEKKVFQTLNLLLASEVHKRFDEAELSLDHYQKTKVTLVKIKKYLDLLLPFYDKDNKQKIENLYKQARIAIGNPGLFGVNSIPFNKFEFVKNKEKLIKVVYKFDK